jgi:cytochrome c556
MSRTSLALIPLVFAAAAASGADAPKPEKVIAYRQGVYHVMGWNWGPMVDMVKGKRPFDAAEFKLRAERLAYVTKFLDEGFPEGSDKGASTDAKPEIWQNKKDFEAKLADLQRESEALAATAASGDEARMKEQLVKTAGTCKACHEKYRAD